MMSDEAFVELLDKTYSGIVSDYMDRMQSASIAALYYRRSEVVNNYGKWEETDFKKFATELYRAWLSGGKDALAAAIEKREQTEGENE